VGIVGMARSIAAAFLLVLSSRDPGLRGISIAWLLAFGLTGAALAEPGEGQASVETQVSQGAQSTDQGETQDPDRLK